MFTAQIAGINCYATSRTGISRDAKQPFLYNRLYNGSQSKGAAVPKPSNFTIVFDTKTVTATLDGADDRKEFRVVTKKGVALPGLALEILSKGRGTWRCIYSVRVGGRRTGRKFKIADAKTELSIVLDHRLINRIHILAAASLTRAR